jgi:GNAT superfamily N-acetyltransferase
MFVEVLGAFVTLVAEVPARSGTGSRLVGLAQLDPAIGRLRALFVAAEAQGEGYGRELLAAIESEAAARRLRRLHGAMSLNAGPFYAANGFHPCPGKRWLLHGGIAVPVLPMEKMLPPAA